MKGGEVKWQTESRLAGQDGMTGLYTENQVRSMFRDIIAGVQYLHCQGYVEV